MKILYMQSLLILLCSSSAYQITSGDNNIQAPRSNSFYTLEEICEKQNNLSALIAQLEAQAKTSLLFRTAEKKQLKAQIPLLEQIVKKQNTYLKLLSNGREISSEVNALSSEIYNISAAIKALNNDESCIEININSTPTHNYFKRPKANK